MGVDRVEYSMSRKISDGNYGSIQCVFSYSTDVRSKETKKDAIERSIMCVEEVILNKIKEYEKDINEGD